MKIPRQIKIVGSLIVILLTVGSAGFHWIQGWPWFQSLYCTLMTVSTIGAEPENQLSQSGRIFNVVLMILGLGVVGFAIGSVTHAVIQSELGSFFGRRRMEREISRLKDHFIVCGAGRVGRRVALEIAAHGLPLVIIEKDAARAQWAQEHNFPVIVGDASSEAVLREAQVESARGLASAVTSDAQNVYIVLTARGMAPGLPIIARASEEDAGSKLLKAGASTVVSPYHYAGQRIARMLTRPNVQRFIDLAMSPLADGDLDLQIEEVEVTAQSRLAGSNLADANIRERFGVIVLAIRRQTGSLEFNPGPEQKVSGGDFLIAMGDSHKLRELETLAGV